ncbi:MAG: rod shape-determining protein MreD [Rhodospirillales bacterium]|nr:rod shape-determining protein MreD [Rhodospirillales bacterium]
MRPSLWHRMDLLARQLTPSMLTLALVIIGVVPLRILEFSTVMPLLPLMAVYHWAVFRPRLLPAYAVFLIGILQDILTGAPVGMNAFIFLLVYGAVLLQKRFFTGRPFLILWLGFALIVACAAALNWLAVSLLSVTIVEIRTAVFQYLLTLGFFPAVAWVFMRWQRAFLRLD